MLHSIKYNILHLLCLLSFIQFQFSIFLFFLRKFNLHFKNLSFFPENFFLLPQQFDMLLELDFFIKQLLFFFCQFSISKIFENGTKECSRSEFVFFSFKILYDYLIITNLYACTDATKSYGEVVRAAIEIYIFKCSAL